MDYSCGLNQFMNQRPLSMTANPRPLTPDHRPLKSHLPTTVKVAHNSLDRSKVNCLQRDAPDKLIQDVTLKPWIHLRFCWLHWQDYILQTVLILRNAGSDCNYSKLSPMIATVHAVESSVRWMYICNIVSTIVLQHLPMATRATITAT